MKNSGQRKALIQTVVLCLVLAAGCALALFWASKAEDSELAENIRRALGIPEPTTGPAVEAVTQPSPPQRSIEEMPPHETEAERIPEPAPPTIPEITFQEICLQRYLWPKTLSLKLSKRVYIRFNGNVYGHMQFTDGMRIEVDALDPNGLISGWVNGNYLNLSIEETDFEEWFRTTYADRFDLQPIEVERSRSATAARHEVGTPAGDEAFWREMRIWCQRNYDTISLEIAEDNLVFRWSPKEDVPINYALEAREIAHKFLMLRSARGSNENYAACEIRDPVTHTLLGASSVFIPRLGE